MRITFSQIIIYPKIGLALSYSKKIEGSPYIYGFKEYDKGIKSKHLGNYSGFDLEKRISKHSIFFNYSSKTIYLSNSVYITPFEHPNTKVGNHSEGTELLTYGISYAYNLDFHLLKKKKLNVTSVYDDYVRDKHWLNFSVAPFVGIGISKLLNTNWNSTQNESEPCKENSIDTTSAGTLVSGIGWDSFDCDGAKTINKIEQSKRGFSLLLGVKFTFLRQYKNGISVSFVYNPHFTTFLKATYSTKIENVKEVQSATFASKGKNIGIYLSYPITILNKKGERYRDRHPKE